MNDARANPNSYAVARSEEDHRARAGEHNRRTREASSAMGRSIRAAGDLFGRELADHLTRRHEDLAEHAGEAFYHLERELARVEEREGQAIRALGVKLEEQRRELARTHHVLTQALDELRRRSKRSGKQVPEFVSEWDREQEAPF